MLGLSDAYSLFLMQYRVGTAFEFEKACLVHLV